ncbi:NAD-binding protein [Myxococcota bacterium]
MIPATTQQQRKNPPDNNTMSHDVGMVSMPNAWGVYRTLASADQWPLEAQAAFECLKTAIDQRGGTLRQTDAAGIENRLACEIAELALEKRARMTAIESLDPKALKPRYNTADFWADAIERTTRRQFNDQPTIESAEVNKSWFALHFAELLIGKSRELAKTETGRVLAPGDEDGFTKLQALQEDEKYGVAPSSDEFVRLRGEALKRIYFGGDGAFADPTSLRHAAGELGGETYEIYRAVDLLSSFDPTVNDPGLAQTLLETAADYGSEAIRISAHEGHQEALGELPVVAATLKMLHGIGFQLPWLGDTEVVVQSHVLPSLQHLIDQMGQSLGLRHLTVVGKSYSSSPVSSVGVEGLAKRFCSAYGESRRTPEEHAESLRAEAMQVLERAERTNRRVVVLGDGPDFAEAFHSAAQDYPSVASGYVEFTQGGLNQWQNIEALSLLVESIADVPLKNLFESSIVGNWIVEQEEAALRSFGLKRLPALRSTIVGCGPIGRGVAQALRARRCQNVTVVESRTDRAEEARGHGFDVVMSEEELPQSELYFSCAGVAKTVDEAFIGSVPSGARIINCGSYDEVDQEIVAGSVNGATVAPLPDSAHPDHQTLAIRFLGLRGKRVFLPNMGHPRFDGVRDNDPMLVDIYMSALLAGLCELTKRMDEAPTASGIEALSADIQLGIVDLIEQHYDADTSEVRTALKGTDHEAAQ